MPKRNTSSTPRCCQAIVGMRERSQSPPMRSTMLLAANQACSFARAGSRLEPLRKNRRVKVMKTKVWNTAQAFESQAMDLDSFAPLGMTVLLSF